MRNRGDAVRFGLCRQQRLQNERTQSYPSRNPSSRNRRKGRGGLLNAAPISPIKGRRRRRHINDLRMSADAMIDRALRFSGAGMTRQIDRNDAPLNVAADPGINGKRGRSSGAKEIDRVRHFNDPGTGLTTNPSADLTKSAVRSSEAVGRSVINARVVESDRSPRAAMIGQAVGVHLDLLVPSARGVAARQSVPAGVGLPRAARRNVLSAGTSGSNAYPVLPPQSFVSVCRR